MKFPVRVAVFTLGTVAVVVLAGGCLYWAAVSVWLMSGGFVKTLAIILVSLGIIFSVLAFVGFLCTFFMFWVRP